VVAKRVGWGEVLVGFIAFWASAALGLLSAFTAEDLDLANGTLPVKELIVAIRRAKRFVIVLGRNG
jgi:hypothetical protein